MTNFDYVKKLLEENNVEYRLHDVDPGKLDIDSTVAHLGIKYKEGLATLIYRVRGNEYIAVLRRDDTMFDMDKLKKVLDTSRVSFASKDDMEKLGIEIGLASPLILHEKGIKVYVDRAVLEMEKAFTGSTSPDYALEIKKDDLLRLLGDFVEIHISEPNPQRQDEGSQAKLHSHSNVKVSTDEKSIDWFLNRGVDSVYPTKEALKEKLMSGERITAYMGFDPTGPYLHVGHAMGIRALRQLQKLGHRVIFLVGDYTARVGDPDKASTRKLLTAQDIEKNMSAWKEQASQLIDFEDPENPVEFLHNFDWLSKLDLEKLIELMSTTTVQQMMERDLFARRLNEKNPIQLQEFIYPLMQGYDSVAMGVDLELGGTDQTFNMLMGRNLVNKYLNKEKFVRANEMMPAPEGLTMSKTKGNGINLSDTPENMYGVAMSYPDEHILTGLRLLTDTPDEELEEIKQNLDKGENPMQYKKLMAYRIVETIKGKDAAEAGQSHFEATVQKREVSEERIKIGIGKLTDRLAHMGKPGDRTSIVSELAAISKTQARQLLSQGGVQINESKLEMNDEKLELKPGDIIKIGKRNWFEIVE